ncbi:hypothetical protein Q361_11724 [Flavobacterium croceum DSM 17960]|uniref:Uncharacterized protein n=1 Tax=Flavobacterium croceum DSM 17960 TaxID=1121886 RepID=A0A2S4N5E6_9FLAO|nr:hypothetical protein [Flavobacterium croceum]POS00921.1 hypothetical protein Q361_11724 [Flavobacterium croceum DSM 17960]
MELEIKNMISKEFKSLPLYGVCQEELDFLEAQKFASLKDFTQTTFPFCFASLSQSELFEAYMFVKAQKYLDLIDSYRAQGYQNSSELELAFLDISTLISSELSLLENLLSKSEFHFTCTSYQSKDSLHIAEVITQEKEVLSEFDLDKHGYIENL